MSVGEHSNSGTGDRRGGASGPSDDATAAPRRPGLAGTEWLGIAALALVLFPGLRAMAGVWSRVDHWSHGYMIPFVALRIASSQRHVLPTLPVARDGRGALVLVAALALYLLGMAVGEVWLSGVGVVAVVAGAVLYARGVAWLRTLCFPLAYLLFMVPLPEAWLAPVIVRLQLLVSSVGSWLLQAIGHPVLRAGNVLQLPSGEELFVAEACSGITSLVTLVPLAAFLAYFTERSPWRRLVLVLTVVPVALLANLTRVLLTVLAANRIGARAATESTLHEWVGLSTYVVGCLVLLGVGALMRRFSPPAEA